MKLKDDSLRPQGGAGAEFNFNINDTSRGDKQDVKFRMKKILPRELMIL